MRRQLILENIDSNSKYRKIEFDVNQQFKNGYIKINQEKDIIDVYFENEDNIIEDMELIKNIIINVDEDIEITEKEITETYRKVLILRNLDCANCAAKIERIAKRNFDYEFLVIDVATSRFIIETTDKDLIDNIDDKLQSIADSVEHGIIVDSKVQRVAPKKEKISKRKLYMFIIGVSIFLIGVITKFILKSVLTDFPLYLDIIIVIAYVVGYILLGSDVLYSAYRNMKSGRVFDENFLMGLATITALAIGYPEEAVSVMIFYKIGELLQDYAVNKSRSSIYSLVGLQSHVANLEVEGEIIEVDPLEIFVGDIVVVKSGEKIPLDGEVVYGSTALDVSALTGESLFKEVTVGDEVLSGSINEGNLIKVKVTRIYEDSTMPKILNLIENASSMKSESENFISKFAKYYTPIVVILAMLMIVFLPIIKQDYSWAMYEESIYKAMVFLVISCPCALVISIPLGFFGGIGAASKEGILVKGSNYLEAVNSVHTVIFDKTGTLTKGEFVISEIVPENGFTKEQVLEYAAYAESTSNHPIAKSIVNAYGLKNIDFNSIETLETESKQGLIVKKNREEIIIGNNKFLSLYDIESQEIEEVGVIVHIAVDRKYIGYLIVKDDIKEEVANSIIELRRLGVQQIIMLTGDNELVARDVAIRVGIDEFYAGLLPGDKVRIIHEVKSKLKEDEKVIFVGDGVNDAPALSTSDIGIAMGALGSDAAIEVADIVLMGDEIHKIPTLLKVARETRKIVVQNIVLAIGVKIIVLLSAPLINVKIWEAIFADVGVSLLAILNSMRIIKNKER